MHDIIKKDIIDVLGRLADILKVKGERDIIEIKELSNSTMHNASIFQDEDSISVAVLIYSLSKIMERKEMDYGKIVSMINSCATYLENSQDDLFRKSIKNIFNFIRSMDEKINLYIHEVISHAQIKKGCKLCENGISIARSAEVLGISQWEIMHYIGKTTLVDQLSEPVNVSKRLKFARSLFS